MTELISTGGTIACEQTENGLFPKLSSRELLSYIDPKRRFGGDVCCRDLFFMDSSNVQPEEWMKIAEAIMNSSSRSIVLTHGTDTMAYTASMLSFLLLGCDKTVVLTGSQRPIIYEDSDGRSNLVDALDIASRLESGVYVCFGGMVMLGVRAVKTHTTSYSAFESVNYPYIARRVNAGFAEPFIKPHRISRNGFVTIDGNVALIKLIPGLPTAVIDNIMLSGLKGVVVEGFGLGGMHNVRRDHSHSIHNLIAAGIPVVMKSQCLYEAASVEVYEVSRTLYEMGVITVGDMTTEAAVTKLMWALGQTDEIDAIRSLMTCNFCDEIHL